MAKTQALATVPSGTTKKQTIEFQLVDDLLFDVENPRLPESVTRVAAPQRPKGRGSNRGHGAPDVQERILEHIRTENLDELARSFADNGYWATEPLIATKDGAPAGKWTVLEGNRRLAALKLVHDGTEEDHALLGIEVDEAIKKQLRRVPVLEVAKRTDATAMIGFRHIGGLKFWESEAKARWIRREVDRAEATDPFAAVARMVGMNRSSIRYYYLAASLAATARDEKGYDLDALVRNDRFGVFLRAVESPKVRKHVGLSDVSSHAEALKTLKVVQKSPTRLIEVLDDIAKPLPTGKYLVGDSRNIPKYGDILASDEVRAVLRQDGMDAAVAALEPVSLLEQAIRVRRNVERLRGKLDREVELPVPVIDAVKEIQRVARGLRNTNG